MTLLTNLTQRIARSPGDPKVMRKGPSSLTGADQLARMLAMFSFGLGMTELLAPGRITRAVGLDGQEGLIRAYGAREISSGIPTFSIDKQVGLRMRLLGDALDIATVLPALSKHNDRRGNAVVALFALIGVTLLDAIAATGTSAVHKRSGVPPRDYSNRSGLPRGVEASRGLARRDFTTPPDYRTPGTVAEAL
jgi:hypothetical protein